MALQLGISAFFNILQFKLPLIFLWRILVSSHGKGQTLFFTCKLLLAVYSSIYDEIQALANV